MSQDEVKAQTESSKPNFEDFASITEEEFKQFLIEKVKNHVCPCCQTNSWAILSSPNMNLSILALSKDGAFSIPPPSIPIMGVGCNTCGYIRQHSKGMVAKWKSEKKANA